MNRTIFILLVEDDELTLFPIEEGLRDEGFEPIVARSGAEALDKLNEDHRRLAAVVTDVRLGGRVDGWKVAHHARSIRSDMPIIYMSGNSAGDWANRGVTGSVMLSKPFAHRELLDALKSLFGARQPRSLEDQ